MKELLVKYKSVIRFIVTFLGVYGTLTIGYYLFLSFSDGSKFYPDYLTNLVAKQTNLILNSVGYETQVLPHPDEPSMKIIINKKFVATVVEGCNAVSIIILFLAFVIAFANTFKITLIYCLLGSVIIYVFNLFRIVVLSIGLYHYPWRQELLHKIIFPLLIYGIVFLLWMFWVNRFSKTIKTNV